MKSDSLRRALGDERIYLVDGGALDGLKEPWSEIDRSVEAIGFEPLLSVDAGARSRTKKGGITLDPVALSDTKGEATFYVMKHADSSSLLRPNKELVDRLGSYAKYEMRETTKVPVDTLDSQCEKHGVPRVDFIKLDTQGSELSILKGAERAIDGSVLGIEIEVNFAERYEGQNFFRDADSFLSSKGFEIYDLERRYAKRKGRESLGGEKGQMTHGTALYFRSLKSMLARSKDDASAARRYIVALALYGYMDAAGEALESLKPFIRVGDYTSIENALRSRSGAAKAASLPKSYKLWRLFTRLARAFKPVSKIGSSGDEGVGNI